MRRKRNDRKQVGKYISITKMNRKNHNVQWRLEMRDNNADFLLADPCKSHSLYTEKPK